MASYQVPPRTTTNSADDEKNYDCIYKLLVIGDSNVGKTTLLTRFCEGRYQSNFMSTVGKSFIMSSTSRAVLFVLYSTIFIWAFGLGIDYKTKVITLDTERVKLQIW